MRSLNPFVQLVMGEQSKCTDVRREAGANPFFGDQKFVFGYDHYNCVDVFGCRGQTPSPKTLFSIVGERNRKVETIKKIENTQVTKVQEHSKLEHRQSKYRSRKLENFTLQ